MHPKTKRYLVFLIVAIVIIIIFVVLSYSVLGPLLCQPPCEWILIWFSGYCDCTPGIPLPPPQIPGLPEGIPGFTWKAIFLGILVAVVFVVAIRRRNE